MMARAFMVAALLALAAAPTVRAHDLQQIPMNAKGKYAESVKPAGNPACHQIFGCIDCEFVDKPVGQKHKSSGSFLQCLACDLQQGYVLNTFTGRCDCAPGFGAPLASGQLTSLWKYVPDYVDDTWTQTGSSTGAAKPILLPDFVWPGKFRYCEVCPAGTYTDGVSPIRTRCLFCPRGKTTSGAGCGDGSGCCDYCAPGWAWDDGKKACQQCAANSYSPGGPASGATVKCTPCPDGGFTLNAGAGSVKQCKVLPKCDNAPNCIIVKGFYIGGQTDGTAVPSTQHYRKKIGDGENGYYCVDCPDGTTSTTGCTSVGGTCKPDSGDTPVPDYKKVHETHFKHGYHGNFKKHDGGDDGDDDDAGDLPGADPVEGYKKVKYEFNKDKSWKDSDNDD